MLTCVASIPSACLRRRQQRRCLGNWCESLLELTCKDVERTRFFAGSDLITDRVHGIPLRKGSHGKKVQSAVSQAVAIVYRGIRSVISVYNRRPNFNTFCILDSCNQVPLGQRPDEFVHAAASKTRNLSNQRCRHDLMIFGAHFHLSGNTNINKELRGFAKLTHSSENAEFFGCNIAQICGVKLHCG